MDIDFGCAVLLLYFRNNTPRLVRGTAHQVEETRVRLGNGQCDLLVDISNLQKKRFNRIENT